MKRNPRPGAQRERGARQNRWKQALVAGPGSPFSRPVLLAGTRISSKCQDHRGWLLGPHDRQPDLPDVMHPVHMRALAWLRGPGSEAVLGGERGGAGSS